MFLNFRIDRRQFRVVDFGVGEVEPFADNVEFLPRHKIGKQRAAPVVEQIAAVFGRVRNNLIHFVQLFAADKVREKRNFVQAFIVSAFGLYARIGHRFKGKLDAGCKNCRHQYAFVEIFLLADRCLAGIRAFECGFSRFFAPF